MTSVTSGEGRLRLLDQGVVALPRSSSAVPFAPRSNVRQMSLTPMRMLSTSGFEVDALSLPAGGQIGNLVAADAAIENLDAVGGAIDQQLRRGEPRVAVAERGLRVRFARRLATAAGVGDRVALEEERDAWFQRRTAGGFGGMRIAVERMRGGERSGADRGKLSARNGRVLRDSTRRAASFRLQWRCEKRLPIA